MARLESLLCAIPHKKELHLHPPKPNGPGILPAAASAAASFHDQNSGAIAFPSRETVAVFSRFTGATVAGVSFLVFIDFSSLILFFLERRLTFVSPPG